MLLDLEKAMEDSGKNGLCRSCLIRVGGVCDESNYSMRDSPILTSDCRNKETSKCQSIAVSAHETAPVSENRTHAAKIGKSDVRSAV